MTHQEIINAEVDNYRAECLKACKDITDKTTKAIAESYDKMYEKIESGMKNNIMQTTNGKEMYDYNSIPLIKYSVCTHPGCSGRGGHYGRTNALHDGPCGYNKIIELDGLPNYLTECRPNCKNKSGYVYVCPGCTTKITFEKFKQMISGERVILLIDKKDYKQENIHTNIYTQYYILVTNYARILKIKINDPTPAQWGGSDKVYDGTYFNFDFWIPIDYIKLLTITQPLNVEDALREMKDVLYNRKFLPLYARDIVKENDELKGKYAFYEAEKKQFDIDRKNLTEEREHFYKMISPWTDLENEKRKMGEMKEKLQIIAQKVKMEREQLDKDKEKFLKRTQEVDINDLDRM